MNKPTMPYTRGALHILTEMYAKWGRCSARVHHRQVAEAAAPLFVSCTLSTLITNWFFKLTCALQNVVDEQLQVCGGAQVLVRLPFGTALTCRS